VARWSALAARHRRPNGPDHATEHLLWQTLVGAWPLDADRLTAYLEKATREAKASTSWLTPVREFDEAVRGFARAVLADPVVMAEVESFVASLAPAWRVTALAQKLVQLTMPGVADTYQGTELFDLSLVDPDNRRRVDYDERLRLLEALTSPGAPVVDDTGAAKLHVVSRALRLRREHPDWFLTPSSYESLDAGARALAFARSGRAVTVVPIRAVQTATQGWGEETVALPDGSWRNILTGVTTSGGDRPLAEILGDFPVALLVKD
jgi:(1->4)-alpha-D-glucan 1-alpha-D-glucosylmutase